MKHAEAQADDAHVATRFTGGIVLRVWVQPGAGRTELSGIQGSELRVRIAQRAVKGAASAALVAYLAKTISLAWGDVEVVSGHTSRTMRVRIYTKGPLILESRLAGLGGASVGQELDTVGELGGK